MAVLTQVMKDMIDNYQSFIATVNKDGTPNISTKRFIRVLNDDTLEITERAGGTTYSNILNGSQVAIAVANRQALDGYRFVGQIEVHNSDEIFEQAVAKSEKAGLPKPKAIVLMHVEQIFGLKPGPTAGKPIV